MASRKDRDRRSGRPASRNSTSADTDNQRKERARKPRNRNVVDPNILIFIGIGVLAVIAALIVVVGNYRPPSPPPGNSQPNTIYVTKKVDKDNNVLTDAQVAQIKERNRAIKDASGKKASKTSKRDRKQAPEENLAAKRFREQYKQESKTTPTISPAISPARNVPVPGWAKDNSGRVIGGNRAVQPATQSQPGQESEAGTHIQPQSPRKRRVSPLAPWKRADGRE